MALAPANSTGHATLMHLHHVFPYLYVADFATPWGWLRMVKQFAHNEVTLAASSG